MDVSRQKNGQVKSGQCHPGYKGKQCQTREYSLVEGVCSISAKIIAFSLELRLLKQMRFILQFPSVKFSKIFTLQTRNTKNVGLRGFSFFGFCKFVSFP